MFFKPFDQLGEGCELAGTVTETIDRKTDVLEVNGFVGQVREKEATRVLCACTEVVRDSGRR